MNQWLIPIMGIDGAAIATGCVWLASGIDGNSDLEGLQNAAYHGAYHL